jgi:hypothetical protein
MPLAGDLANWLLSSGRSAVSTTEGDVPSSGVFSVLTEARVPPEWAPGGTGACFDLRGFRKKRN